MLACFNCRIFVNDWKSCEDFFCCKGWGLIWGRRGHCWRLSMSTFNSRPVVDWKVSDPMCIFVGLVTLHSKKGFCHVWDLEFFLLWFEVQISFYWLDLRNLKKCLDFFVKTSLKNVCAQFYNYSVLSEELLSSKFSVRISTIFALMLKDFHFTEIDRKMAKIEKK